MPLAPARFHRDGEASAETGNGWRSGILKSAETGLLVWLEPDPPPDPFELQIRRWALTTVQAAAVVTSQESGVGQGIWSFHMRLGSARHCLIAPDEA